MFLNKNSKMKRAKWTTSRALLLTSQKKSRSVVRSEAISCPVCYSHNLIVDESDEELLHIECLDCGHSCFTGEE